MCLILRRAIEPGRLHACDVLFFGLLVFELGVAKHVERLKRVSVQCGHMPSIVTGPSQAEKRLVDPVTAVVYLDQKATTTNVQCLGFFPEAAETDL